MANDGNDTLMRVVVKGSPIKAECQTEVTRDGDPYVDDYLNGQFFEIDEFRFNLKVVDNADKSADKTGSQQKDSGQRASLNQGARTGMTQGRTMTAADAKSAVSAAGDSTPDIPFYKWKSSTPQQVADIMKVMPYPIDMGEVSIERTYDKASPVLFDYCCNSKVFDSMSMIKRKDIGDVFLRGYLRIDFDEVLITSIDWKNGEVIKESFTFVFRSLCVQYRVAAFEPGQAVATLKDQPPVLWDYGLDLKATQ